MSSRAELRVALGPAAVVTVHEAAKRLPITDSDAEQFLRERGLVRALKGKEVVIWGDVLEALRGSSSSPVSLPYVDPSVP